MNSPTLRLTSSSSGLNDDEVHSHRTTLTEVIKNSSAKCRVFTEGRSACSLPSDSNNRNLLKNTSSKSSSFSHFHHMGVGLSSHDSFHGSYPAPRQQQSVVTGASMYSVPSRPCHFSAGWFVTHPPCRFLPQTHKVRRKRGG